MLIRSDAFPEEWPASCQIRVDYDTLGNLELFMLTKDYLTILEIFGENYCALRPPNSYVQLGDNGDVVYLSVGSSNSSSNRMFLAVKLFV